MNNNTLQTKHVATSNQTLMSNIFEKEPFLLQEMTQDEFEQYVLLNNDEISIDNIDFKPLRFTA